MSTKRSTLAPASKSVPECLQSLVVKVLGRRPENSLTETRPDLQGVLAPLTRRVGVQIDAGPDPGAFETGNLYSDLIHDDGEDLRCTTFGGDLSDRIEAHALLRTPVRGKPDVRSDRRGKSSAARKRSAVVTRKVSIRFGRQRVENHRTKNRPCRDGALRRDRQAMGR